MRDLLRQVLQGYQSLKSEGEDKGYLEVSAQEPDTHQPVSIKILPRLLGEDPQIEARFEDLSRAIRQLNHPNIAAVRKVGNEAGLPYVVTRTLEKGHSLAQSLDQPWAIDVAADVVMHVGQALEHAYRKGVVHGDLTPDKIVLQDDGRILVTDLGLGELMDLVGGSAKQAASPYLAPERLAGTPAGPQADVYSLAAILYSMLTNKMPQVTKGVVLPPSRFNPDVPEDMDKVLVKALSPEPEDRYPDIQSFLAAFGSVTLLPVAEKAPARMAGVECPHCGTGGQTGRFCRKCGQRLMRPEAAAPSPPPRSGSVLDEPIQVTRVDVGQIEVGSGIEQQETVIAQPMMVATGDLDVEFPSPLEMPRLDLEDLWPERGDQPLITMPELPEMPIIDWAEVAPPMPEVPKIFDISVGEVED
jgi:serine/threonine protein kinase